MKSIRIEPQDIKLNLITHGHPDHMGSAKDIKEITRARIAMHQLDKVCLETGEWNTKGHRPKGTGLWSSIAAGYPIRLSTYAIPKLRLARASMQNLMSRRDRH